VSPSAPSEQSKDPEQADSTPQSKEIVQDQARTSTSFAPSAKQNFTDPVTAVGSSSSASSQSSTPGSGNSQTELRNVAEILASLSGGYLQDPGKNTDNENSRGSMMRIGVDNPGVYCFNIKIC
jgi:hypothetical protein